LASSRRKLSEIPEVKRRRLRGALRQAREAAGLAQKDAAAALDWSVSKIIRIEQGTIGVTSIDLRALLAVYQITDEKTVDELVELARGSSKQSWREYKNVYSPASLALFSCEAIAKIIYKYEPTFVPGLLQTEDYARALMTSLGHREDEIKRMVSARLERQKLLDRDPHRPELQFILGEAAVSRAVGGRGVMLRQLKRLKELAARPRISLQVLPFSSGAHPRMGEAFTILKFSDESLDDLLYLENAGGASISREDPELIADYTKDFLVLQDMACEKDSFSKVIDAVIAARFTDPAQDRLKQTACPPK
jgi:transcriptional regulator with XRE-family HTH domain